MTTVKVQFKDGEREVPAHYEQQGYLFGGRPEGKPTINRLVPDDIRGYRFEETISGKWFAFKDHRYEGE